MPPRAIDMAGLQSRAFAPGPAWSADTGYQAEIDAAARRGINQRYREGLEQINVEEAARGNPMQRAIEAQDLSNKYEQGLPFGATSDVEATFGEGWGPGLEGAEVGSEGAGERPLGRPTVGDVRAIDLAQVNAQARHSPEKRTEAGLDAKRARLVAELELLEKNLDEDVVAGKITEDEAVAHYQAALRKAQAYAEMLKGGFPPVNLAETISRGLGGQDAQRTMDLEKGR